MKDKIFLMAAVLSLCSCGASSDQQSTSDAHIETNKSEAQKADEAYDLFSSSLSQSEKCAKRKEIADLYYKENDVENYEWAKSRANVACSGN